MGERKGTNEADIMKEAHKMECALHFNILKSIQNTPRKIGEIIRYVAVKMDLDEGILKPLIIRRLQRDLGNNFVSRNSKGEFLFIDPHTEGEQYEREFDFIHMDSDFEPTRNESNQQTIGQVCPQSLICMDPDDFKLPNKKRDKSPNRQRQQRHQKRQEILQQFKRTKEEPKAELSSGFPVKVSKCLKRPYRQEERHFCAPVCSKRMRFGPNVEGPMMRPQPFNYNAWHFPAPYRPYPCVPMKPLPPPPTPAYPLTMTKRIPIQMIQNGHCRRNSVEALRFRAPVQMPKCYKRKAQVGTQKARKKRLNKMKKVLRANKANQVSQIIPPMTQCVLPETPQLPPLTPVPAPAPPTPPYLMNSRKSHSHHPALPPAVAVVNPNQSLEQTNEPARMAFSFDYSSELSTDLKSSATDLPPSQDSQQGEEIFKPFSFLSDSSSVPAGPRSFQIESYSRVDSHSNKFASSVSSSIEDFKFQLPSVSSVLNLASQIKLEQLQQQHQPLQQQCWSSMSDSLSEKDSSSSSKAPQQHINQCCHIKAPEPTKKHMNCFVQAKCAYEQIRKMLPWNNRRSQSSEEDLQLIKSGPQAMIDDSIYQPQQTRDLLGLNKSLSGFSVMAQVKLQKPQAPDGFNDQQSSGSEYTTTTFVAHIRIQKSGMNLQKVEDGAQREETHAHHRCQHRHHRKRKADPLPEPPRAKMPRTGHSPMPATNEMRRNEPPVVYYPEDLRHPDLEERKRNELRKAARKAKGRKEKAQASPDPDYCQWAEEEEEKPKVAEKPQKRQTSSSLMLKQPTARELQREASKPPTHETDLKTSRATPPPQARDTKNFDRSQRRSQKRPHPDGRDPHQKEEHPVPQKRYKTLAHCDTGNFPVGPNICCKNLSPRPLVINKSSMQGFCHRQCNCLGKTREVIVKNAGGSQERLQRHRAKESGSDNPALINVRGTTELFKNLSEIARIVKDKIERSKLESQGAERTADCYQGATKSNFNGNRVQTLWSTPLGPYTKQRYDAEESSSEEEEDDEKHKEESMQSQEDYANPQAEKQASLIEQVTSGVFENIEEQKTSSGNSDNSPKDRVRMMSLALQLQAMKYKKSQFISSVKAKGVEPDQREVGPPVLHCLRSLAQQKLEKRTSTESLTSFAKPGDPNYPSIHYIKAKLDAYKLSDSSSSEELSQVLAPARVEITEPRIDEFLENELQPQPIDDLKSQKSSSLTSTTTNEFEGLCQAHQEENDTQMESTSVDSNQTPIESTEAEAEIQDCQPVVPSTSETQSPSTKLNTNADDEVKPASLLVIWPEATPKKYVADLLKFPEEPESKDEETQSPVTAENLPDEAEAEVQDVLSASSSHSVELEQVDDTVTVSNETQILEELNKYNELNAKQNEREKTNAVSHREIVLNLVDVPQAESLPCQTNPEDERNNLIDEVSAAAGSQLTVAPSKISSTGTIASSSSANELLPLGHTSSPPSTPQLPDLTSSDLNTSRAASCHSLGAAAEDSLNSDLLSIMHEIAEPPILSQPQRIAELPLPEAYEPSD